MTERSALPTDCQQKQGAPPAALESSGHLGALFAGGSWLATQLVRGPVTFQPRRSGPERYVGSQKRTPGVPGRGTALRSPYRGSRLPVLEGDVRWCAGQLGLRLIQPIRQPLKPLAYRFAVLLTALLDEVVPQPSPADSHWTAEELTDERQLDLSPEHQHPKALPSRSQSVKQGHLSAGMRFDLALGQLAIGKRVDNQ